MTLLSMLDNCICREHAIINNFLRSKTRSKTKKTDNTKKSFFDKTDLLFKLPHFLKTISYQ